MEAAEEAREEVAAGEAATVEAEVEAPDSSQVVGVAHGRRVPGDPSGDRGSNTPVRDTVAPSGPSQGS